MNILLLGCGGNAGMNFVKSIKLGNSQAKIVGCDLSWYKLAASNSDYKHLELNDGEKVSRLLDLILKYDIKFVHAQPDSEVRWLLETPEMKPYRFPHSLDIWHKFTDKLYCQRAWGGIKAYSMRRITDFPSLLEDFGGKMWVRAISGAGSKAALPVATFKQARAWVDYWIEYRGMKEADFMIAEYLPGKEYAVQTFWVDGELIQSQARERIVPFFEKIMASRQSSTPELSCTVHDRKVYDTAYSAIHKIDPKPHGIYCVDLKTNRAGTIIPMEVNYGRFFTCTDFFARLNVNTPYAIASYFLTGTKHYRVETIKDAYYWIRRIDGEPYLKKGV